MTLVKLVELKFRSVRFIFSPLAHGVVDFVALTAADSDWVEILEGAQAHA